MITRKELYDRMHHDQYVAEENDSYLVFINQPPSDEWLEKNKSAGTKYLPIEKQEFLMNYVFQEWWAEIRSYQLILNSLVVQTRVHYKHPVTSVWLQSDGIGAWPVQLDAGSKASEIENIKAMAIQMNIPAAFSMSKGNAIEQIGKMFGGGLNRKNRMLYEGGYEAPGGKQKEEGERKSIEVDSSITAGPVPTPLQTKRKISL